jgi:hypothetical protein
VAVSEPEESHLDQMSFKKTWERTLRKAGMLRQTDAKMFKKYSQNREALAKLNRKPNETEPGSGSNTEPKS